MCQRALHSFERKECKYEEHDSLYDSKGYFCLAHQLKNLKWNSFSQHQMLLTLHLELNLIERMWPQAKRYTKTILQLRPMINQL